MQRRMVFGVVIAVAAAHWWVVWGPGFSQVDGSRWETDAPQRLETVWVQMPPAEAALPVAVPPARSTPPSKKAVTPARPEPIKPASEQTLIPMAEVDQAPVQAEETVRASPPVVEEVGGTIAVEPTAPHLQVHDAAGVPLQFHVAEQDMAAAQHHRLRFQVHGFVKGMEYHAQAEMSWTVEGTQYQARQSIRAFLLGSREQTSQGTWGAQGLQPLEFTDRRFAKRRSVQFDWAQGQALFTPERPPAAIGPGAQDRLSVFLQLAAMLQTMPQLRTPGTRVQVPTLGSRSLQMWTFVVEGEETVEVPAGRLPTLRLRREPQAGEQESAQLWVSPSTHYLPARIHLEESNGDVMDFLLKP